MEEGLSFLARANVLRVSEADSMTLERVGRFVALELERQKQEARALREMERRNRQRR